MIGRARTARAPGDPDGDGCRDSEVDVERELRAVLLGRNRSERGRKRAVNPATGATSAHQGVPHFRRPPIRSPSRTPASIRGGRDAVDDAVRLDMRILQLRPQHVHRFRRGHTRPNGGSARWSCRARGARGPPPLRIPAPPRRSRPDRAPCAIPEARARRWKDSMSSVTERSCPTTIPGVAISTRHPRAANVYAVDVAWWNPSSSSSSSPWRPTRRLGRRSCRRYLSPAEGGRCSSTSAHHREHLGQRRQLRGHG